MKTRIKTVQRDILGYKVNRIANDRARQHLENIRNNNEQDSGNQPPTVFVQEFI